MLARIMELLEEHGRLTLAELANSLGAPEDAVKPMMDLLVRKGRVEELGGTCPKGSCAECSFSCGDSAAVYRTGIKHSTDPGGQQGG